MTEQMPNNNQDEVRRWETPANAPQPQNVSPYYPAPEPKKSSKTWLIILIVVLLLCCCLITISLLVASFMFGDNGQWQIDFSTLPMLSSLL